METYIHLRERSLNILKLKKKKQQQKKKTP